MGSFNKSSRLQSQQLFVSFEGEELIPIISKNGF